MLLLYECIFSRCDVTGVVCLLSFKRGSSAPRVRFLSPFSCLMPRTASSVCMQTMVSGVVSLEVNHKKGVVIVRGRPEAAEEGRKEFQNKLASLFPGEFLAVRSSSLIFLFSLALFTFVSSFWSSHWRRYGVVAV